MIYPLPIAPIVLEHQYILLQTSNYPSESTFRTAIPRPQENEASFHCQDHFFQATALAEDEQYATKAASSLDGYA
jgi:hypothetical protein